MSDQLPNIQSQLQALAERFEREKQEILRKSVEPYQHKLNELEHQIATLEQEAAKLRDYIQAALGTPVAAKATAVKKTRKRREIMTRDEKKAKIVQIFNEENISDNFPVRAIAKRLQNEAHLSFADLSPQNLVGFLPAGWTVSGGGRQKKFTRTH